MTEAAIIAGALVDVRNVGTHKSVKLTIHVPEEHATRVVAAFGWPTGVNPVSVAIARLESPLPLHSAEAAPRPAPRAPQPLPAGENKSKRSFDEMAPSQQAGMLSQDRAFRLFLAEKFDMPIPDPDEAASVIRHHCKVTSRAQIKPDNAEWSALVLAYRLWARAPAHGVEA
jgi:hypothetical protein